MSECDESIIAIENVSIRKLYTITTKKTNAMAINVTRTTSINSHSKKVRGCYFLHPVLVAIILLLIIIIVCYYYAKKERYTMGNNEF